MARDGYCPQYARASLDGGHARLQRGSVLPDLRIEGREYLVDVHHGTRSRATAFAQQSWVLAKPAHRAADCGTEAVGHLG